MPVQWELRGALLILVFSGVVEKEEIERALAVALSDSRCRPGMRLLWDARSSQTPVSAEDLSWRFELVSALAERGSVCRVALLVTERWRATLDYLRVEAPRVMPGLPAGVFTDEAEALAWLEAGAED